MLTLSRKTTETITLSHNGQELATVSIVSIKGSQVRVGIEAPKDVLVLRGELVGRTEREAA